MRGADGRAVDADRPPARTAGPGCPPGPAVSRFRDRRGSGVLVLLPLPSRCPEEVLPADPWTVFSARESLDLACGPASLSWAGKYAAKLAVIELLGLTEPVWSDVEILPDEADCRAPGGPCRARHRPSVVLSGAARTAAGGARGGRIAVTITHETTAAAALVVWDRTATAPV